MNLQLDPTESLPAGLTGFENDALNAQRTIKNLNGAD